MRDDPCFRCPLPDCDETSPRCVVRRLSNAYDAKVRQGRHAEITDAEREAQNRIFHIWHLERLSQAAEGVRPYQRYRPAAGRKPARASAGVLGEPTVSPVLRTPGGGAASDSERGAP